MKRGKNFEMHCTTRKLNEVNDNECNWYCMTLKEDFIETIKRYGRLPFTSTTESLEAIKELED